MCSETCTKQLDVKGLEGQRGRRGLERRVRVARSAKDLGRHEGKGDGLTARVKGHPPPSLSSSSPSPLPFRLLSSSLLKPHLRVDDGIVHQPRTRQLVRDGPTPDSPTASATGIEVNTGAGQRVGAWAAGAAARRWRHPGWGRVGRSDPAGWVRRAVLVAGKHGQVSDGASGGMKTPFGGGGGGTPLPGGVLGKGGGGGKEDEVLKKSCLTKAEEGVPAIMTY